MIFYLLAKTTRTPVVFFQEATFVLNYSLVVVIIGATKPSVITSPVNFLVFPTTTTTFCHPFLAEVVNCC